MQRRERRAHTIVILNFTMLLLIDNYDSFTYNLVQRLRRDQRQTADEGQPKRSNHASTKSRPWRPRTSSFRRGRARRVKRAFPTTC